MPPSVSSSGGLSSAFAASRTAAPDAGGATRDRFASASRSARVASTDDDYADVEAETTARC